MPKITSITSVIINTSVTGNYYAKKENSCRVRE